MLFYGDVNRELQPSSIHGSINKKLEAVVAAAPGRKRHEELVRAFIETGELVQGLVDQEFDAYGADNLSQMHKDGLSVLLALADAVKASWESGYTGDLGTERDWASLLDRLYGALPVRLKRAEGYAFYCLYPESYLEAARRSGLGPSTVIIGLRSIGAGLAALVASAIGTRRILTLRPAGHPFDRRLAISGALTREILKDRSADFAIVDEGPGLSGSSFGCVADWLIAHNIEPARIHFFPSHDGAPGSRASASHRARWDALARHVTGFDEIFLEKPGPIPLQHWVSELAVEPVQGWTEISGGTWRALHYSSQSAWPAAHPPMEKRKFLMREEDRTWLVKFAGLDDLASRRLRASAKLGEAGFVPPHKGAVYGFLVEEWVSAKPADFAALDNDDVIDPIGRYLGFRAQHLAPPHGGASLTDLCAMAAFNVGEALGADVADALRKRIGTISHLETRLRRSDTDNRMHRWEWLVTPAGDLLKTDAIDHNAAHDFVGCQDISWDIAGAAVEFALSEPQRRRLAERVATLADYEPQHDALRIFEYCYLAFQIGLWTHAHSGANQDEARRIKGALQRYIDRLTLLLVDR